VDDGSRYDRSPISPTVVPDRNLDPQKRGRGGRKGMGEATIRILGVYKVDMTDDRLRQTMDEKYGGIALSESERRQVEECVREELSSVVLIEVLVENRDDHFDVGDFTQPGREQVAYDEAYLSPDGTSVLSRLRMPEDGSLRLAFFLHFFDPEKPLVTSYGELPTPPIQKMPDILPLLVLYEPVT
jgi:hypothetical protein